MSPTFIPHPTHLVLLSPATICSLVAFSSSSTCCLHLTWYSLLPLLHSSLNLCYSRSLSESPPHVLPFLIFSSHMWKWERKRKKGKGQSPGGSCYTEAGCIESARARSCDYRWWAKQAECQSRCPSWGEYVSMLQEAVLQWLRFIQFKMLFSNSNSSDTVTRVTFTLLHSHKILSGILSTGMSDLIIAPAGYLLLQWDISDLSF